ncbi:hypothetical protein L0B53_18540 (plasmid) [Vibrio sp. SS-MA-C1-2]|uniref:hypothetical protein n=1 Tax=Vibrio sp. SS-MA-C1-2 TaxID=2908646 RepID=UPI001F272725|nr:hypothetical protein [Vibrio sp. SS-MA-C1-2]UJF20322.1 hypothetical protein L0B53_18540 [Vibrio sp. SS-MA-C1-2]
MEKDSKVLIAINVAVWGLSNFGDIRLEPVYFTIEILAILVLMTFIIITNRIKLVIISIASLTLKLAYELHLLFKFNLNNNPYNLALMSVFFLILIYLIIDKIKNRDSLI